MTSTLIRILIPVIFFAVACSSEQDAMGEGGSSGAVELAQDARPAPRFDAVDQYGRPFTSSSLEGTRWIASFFFTSCETVCPALNTVKAGIQSEHGEHVKFVSISTDPDTDTQAALATYAEAYGAIKDTWWMVRMPLDSMRAVATSGFAVMDPREPAMHSTRLIAVNADMTIAGYYDSTDSSDLAALDQWISSQL